MAARIQFHCLCGITVPGDIVHITIRGPDAGPLEYPLLTDNREWPHWKTLPLEFVVRGALRLTYKYFIKRDDGGGFLRDEFHWGSRSVTLLQGHAHVVSDFWGDIQRTRVEWQRMAPAPNPAQGLQPAWPPAAAAAAPQQPAVGGAGGAVLANAVSACALRLSKEEELKQQVRRAASNSLLVRENLEEMPLEMIRELMHDRRRDLELLAVMVGKKEAQEQETCIICCEKEKEVVFIPCRHQCICSTCWRKLRDRGIYKCPICQQIPARIILPAK
ncbi:unnamed protein product [Vitrella brassicaformis CCMP3155]|uniref:RING-type domain-containing protein n=2 Tax=Vitrella brassicaformis TaxID=1169539 RepID=A0A0G4G5T1_VITBC|nr:unnamed protein product [Vitrella brassicaformis CCMP3155]|eukprot:CEM23846.1 unnamed protein product [Vitrella brassicaformis CCMP3155]